MSLNILTPGSIYVATAFSVQVYIFLGSRITRIHSPGQLFEGETWSQLRGMAETWASLSSMFCEMWVITVPPHRRL